MAQNTVNASALLYDGLSDPNTFVSGFILQSTIFGWDDAKQLASLHAFLTGKAKRVYSAIDNTAKATIAQALAALVKALELPRETLLMQYYAERRRSDEPLSKFAGRLQEMLLKAMPNLSADDATHMLRMHICTHLPEHLRALVVFSPEMTYDKLLVSLDKAVPHVAAHSRLSTGSGASSSTTPAPVPLIKSEPDIDSNQASTQQQQSTNQFNNNRGNQQVQRYQQRSQTQGQQSDSKQRQQRFNGNCGYCGIHGHKEVDCRKKRRDNNSNEHLQQPFATPRGHTSYNNNSSNNRTSTNSASTQEDCFPYFSSETQSITIAQVSAAATSQAVGASLLKVSARLVLFDQPQQSVTALIDGGSTHSFISPTILTKAQLAVAADPLQCPRFNYEISGVTGQAKSSCNVVEPALGIGNWQGTHEFVISGSVTTHQMLLGRDFLTRHNVVVEHASNVVTIGNIRLQVNTLDTSATPLAPLTNAMIVANQKQIFDQLASMRSELGKLAVPSKLDAGLSTPSSDVMRSSPPVLHVSANSISAICVATADTVIEPRSQRLVQFSTAPSLHFDCNMVILEPFRTQPSQFVVARSAHAPSSSHQFCSVLNPSDNKLIIAANTQLGQLSEADEANIKFDGDVISYQPLDVDMLKQQAASTPPLFQSSPEVFERLSSLRISDQLEIVSSEINCLSSSFIISLAHAYTQLTSTR